MTLSPLRIIAFSLLTALFAADAYAQTKRIVTYSSGTGFFVSRQGHIVTNAHVLKKCKKINIAGTDIAPTQARLVKHDKNLDLAILKANIRPPRVAFLRSPQSTFNVGEKVMVLGYPGESAKTGKYDVKYSAVKSLKGPLGSKDHIQFNNASAQGNSGGPLLDFAGNVIGVVTAKASIYQSSKNSTGKKLVGTSDIAISLPTLRNYLKRNSVLFYPRDSLMQLSKGRMEKQARSFTVSIMCEQNTTTKHVNTPHEPRTRNLSNQNIK